jgi:hypothetical protein
MAGKRKAGKTGREKRDLLPSGDLLRQTLSAALLQQEDFIITYETTDEGNRVMHVMTGNLITPCMLGTLSNRCEQPEPGTSRHLVLKPA